MPLEEGEMTREGESLQLVLTDSLQSQEDQVG